MWLFVNVLYKRCKDNKHKKKKNQDFFEEEEDIWIMHASQFCVYGEMQSL